MKIFLSFFACLLTICMIITLSVIGGDINLSIPTLTGSADLIQFTTEEESTLPPETDNTDIVDSENDYIQLTDAEDDNRFAEFCENFSQTKTIIVYNSTTDTTAEFNLEDYLCGTVFSEMPSSFEIEALKAQAVAARSYCIYKIFNQSEEEREQHHGAHICDNPSCCKGYISYEDAVKKWGLDYITPLWEKVKTSVAETDGKIIIYQKEPAIAVFHAMSGSMTENSEAVWGNAIPYLVGVSTPEEANSSSINNFLTLEIVDANDFRDKILNSGIKVDFNSSPDTWLHNPVYNASGRLETMEIGEKKIRGTQIRDIFSLRSTDFMVSYNDKDNSFTFNVKGYGHGVGLSQYGANLLAKEGKTYEEILLWYYSGVEITDLYVRVADLTIAE